MDTQRFMKRVAEDSVFYMENFLKIRTKEGTLTNFKLNPMQKKSMKVINKLKREEKPIRVIWLKARQHGISTLCEGLIFQNTGTRAFRNSLIIAHEDKATQNLFSMSKLFYEELPSVLRPMKKYSNEQALTFENPTTDEDEKQKNPGLRSKITVATARNVQTARSNTLHNVHLSEVAFWEDPDTLMTGLLQCVPDNPNTMVFIESTANGIGGWFYDFWKRSEKGETDYVPIFLAWFENPEYSRPFSSKLEKKAFIEDVMQNAYDESGNVVKSEERILHEDYGVSFEQLNWRKWCIANKLNGNLDKFHQEYPSTPDEAFIASGRPVFNINALKQYKAAVREPLLTGYLSDSEGKPKFADDPKGYVRIWRKPETDKFYAIGGDVAEGLASGDYSCAVVLDEEYNLCASWHGHIDPDLFGDEMVKLAKFYNDAYVAPEANNHGAATVRAILRKEYWNIYYQKNYSKITDTITQKPGWLTSVRTKPLMIDKLSEFIREKWIDMPWDTLVSECFTYVIDDDGRTNAQAGSHDDTVMALAIALQLLLENRGDNYEPEVPRDQQRSHGEYDGDAYGEELGVDKFEEEEYSV